MSGTSRKTKQAARLREFGGASNGGPPKSSDPVGEALAGLTPLQRLKHLSGGVEFLRVRQVGRQDSRWYFTVRGGDGKPVELRSFTTKQLRTLSNLSDRVYEADGGDLPSPRKGSAEYLAFMDALRGATEFEEHGATEEGTWRRRLALHLEGSLRRLDVEEKPGDKRAAVEEPGPFESGDHLYVHAGGWLDYLEHRRMDADAAGLQAALRQLGFEPVQLTARVEGSNRSRRYWRSPPDFDWRAEESG